MGGDVESIGIAEARSALAWWLEAGVDVAVQEEPRDWLSASLPLAEAVPRSPNANSPKPSQRRSRRFATGLRAA